MDRTTTTAGLLLKRGLDILCSGAVLMVCSPILLGAAVLVYLEDRGPILFTQERVGRDGHSFVVWKFRSMKVNRRPVEEVGLVTEDHPLVTRTGRFLRRYKIGSRWSGTTPMSGGASPCARE